MIEGRRVFGGGVSKSGATALVRDGLSENKPILEAYVASGEFVYVLTSLIWTEFESIGRTYFETVLQNIVLE